MGEPNYNEFQTGKFARYVTPIGTNVTTPNNITPIIDYPTLVSQGLISGHTHESRVGTNNAIPSNVFILLSNVTSSSSPLNFPAAAQQMQIISDSASDTSAGTGAQQVKITYLKTDFTVNTEFVLTNGVAAVTTTNTDIFRIDKFEVSRAGSTKTGIGNISLQSVGGATTFEKIEAGTNINRSCIHFVPKGYKSTLFSVTKGASTAAGVIFIVEETNQYQGTNVVTHGIEQLELGNFAVHNNIIPPHTIRNPDGLEMFFALVVKGRAANQVGSGTIHFIDSLI